MKNEEALYDSSWFEDDVLIRAECSVRYGCYPMRMTFNKITGSLKFWRASNRKNGADITWTENCRRSERVML